MSLATRQLNPSVYQGASTQRAINIHCNTTVFSHTSLQRLQRQRRVVSRLLGGCGTEVSECFRDLVGVQKRHDKSEKRGEIGRGERCYNSLLPSSN